MPAINAALASEVHGVEIDIELTKDSELAVIHQETFNLENNKLIPAQENESRAWVNEKTFDEIKKVDAGSYLDSKFSNLKIPSLEEVLRIYKSNKKLLIELKDPYYWKGRNIKYENRMVRAVKNILSPDKNIYLISFNEHLAKAFKGFQSMWLVWKNTSIDKAKTVINQNDFASIGIADFMAIENPKWFEIRETSSVYNYTYGIETPILYKQKYSKLINQIRKQNGFFITDFPANLYSTFQKFLPK